jgi:hypothetical protein
MTRGGLDTYRLEGREPVRCSMLEWAKEFERRRPGWRVAETVPSPGLRVSTIFLGIDHGWGPGPPILFETMVFNDYGDGDCRRYATWAEAELGHMEIVEALQRRIDGEKAGADGPGIS